MLLQNTSIMQNIGKIEYESGLTKLGNLSGNFDMLDFAGLLPGGKYMI